MKCILFCIVIFVVCPLSAGICSSKPKCVESEDVSDWCELKIEHGFIDLSKVEAALERTLQYYPGSSHKVSHDGYYVYLQNSCADRKLQKFFKRAIPHIREVACLGLQKDHRVETVRLLGDTAQSCGMRFDDVDAI